jgi:hypothetical protein
VPRHKTLTGWNIRAIEGPLSDVFLILRLQSCVYFQRDLYAPWGIRIEGIGFEHFHVVTRRNCVMEMDQRARIVVSAMSCCFHGVPRG